MCVKYHVASFKKGCKDRKTVDVTQIINHLLNDLCLISTQLQAEQGQNEIINISIIIVDKEESSK